MSTSLTLYAISTASSTLTTAENLISSGATGAAGTVQNTTVGTATNWGEIVPLGTSSAWAGAGSQGSPTGNGLLFDVTTLEGQTIIAGNWTPTINLKAGGTGGPTLNGTLVVRHYKRSSGGTYTLIGTSTLASQSFSSTSTSFAFSSSSLSSVSFATGDKLYIDVWMNITSSTLTTAGTNIGWKPSSITTSGWTGSQFVTPGYQASGTAITRDLFSRLRLLATSSRDVVSRVRLASPVQFKDIAVRLNLLAISQRDIASRVRLASPVQFKDIAVRLRLGLGRDVAVRLRLLATNNRDLSSRLRLASPTRFKDIAARLRLFLGKDLAVRLRLSSPYHDIASRLGLVPAIGSSTTTAFGLEAAQHTWLLPDNTMIAVYQAGTDTTYAASGVLVLQSANWQSANPTWTFVKQIATSTTTRVSSWWDGARLHTVVGVTVTTGSTLAYFSGTYSSGTWTWDSAPTQIGTTTTASVPVICPDYSNNTIFVVYRQNTTGTYSLQASVNISGTWQTPYQVSTTTPTASTMYATMTRAGSNIVLVTYESNNTLYASVHPDGTNYQTGWGAFVAGSTSSGVPGALYGTVSAYADSSTSAWVSWGASGGTPGLFLQRLTLSGTSVTWQSTAQTVTSTSNTSCVVFSSALGTLYGIYYQGSQASANIFFTTLPAGTSSWTIPSNITYAAGAANVSPTVPTSTAFGVLPVFFQTTTAGDAPIAQLNLNFNKDLAVRLRLAMSKTQDLALRMRLAIGQQRDVALRFRVLAVVQRDTALRVRVRSPLVFRDIALRMRLLSTVVSRDMTTRVRLSSIVTPHDIFSRLRVLATTSKDLAARLRVLATTSKDVALRVKVSSAGQFRDVAARVRLLVPTSRDVVARVRLLAVLQRDLVVRYRVQPAPSSMRDLFSRLRLLATSSRDVVSRVRLLATASRDIAARVKVSSATYSRDVATRVKVLATTNKDIAARLKVNSAVLPRDIVARARLSATTQRDATVRLRLQPPIQVVRDLLLRLRLLVPTSRDVALRFRMLMTTQRDIVSRVRVLATTSRDMPLRTRLLATIQKDTVLRARLLATTQRDIATRTRLIATTQRDIAARARLSAALSRDLALRVRLTSVLLAHDFVLRMRLQGTTTKDLRVRIKVLASVSRDMDVRMRLSSIGQTRDMAIRARVAQPKTSDMALRLRLQGVPIIAVQIYGRDYTVQVGGR